MDQPKMPHVAQPEPDHSAVDGTSSPTAEKSEAGRPKPAIKRTKPLRVAVLGTAPETMNDAPFNDSSWQIWTCSGLAFTAQRFDRHFELHDYQEVARGWTGSPEHDAQMAEQYMQTLARVQPPRIVYMRAVDPRIPASVRFPIDQVFDAFPERYFASTVSYMIALAILEGADEIGLWGVDMALSSEQYSGQRASAEWLLGYARGLGIRITIPPEADLLKIIEPYAYGTNNAGIRKIIAKKKVIEQRLKQAEAAKLQAEREIAGLSGAQDGLDYVSRCWQGSSNG